MRTSATIIKILLIALAATALLFAFRPKAPLEHAIEESPRVKASPEKMYQDALGWGFSISLAQPTIWRVKRPDGSDEAWDLDKLERLSVYRLNASESPTTKHQYFWVFELKGEEPKRYPYVATEAHKMVQMLWDFARIDTDFSGTGGDMFYHQDRFNICTVWSAPGVPSVPVPRGYKECPPGEPVWQKPKS